ncbi:beta strand repeat-containing protein, partial [Kordiimonas aquimaris]|uniref:beta strand repeat-containing protein n=1 Tax=Kordiimonas aquimaris TaxID=707591 RepID=UPI0029432DA8
MPSISGFTWDSIERPVVDGTQLEVGVGKTYATVQDAVAAANVGDTITIYTDTATQSFIMGTGAVLEVGVGKQYTKLQDAVIASSPDDIILLHEGTYNFHGNENYYNTDPNSNFYNTPAHVQHNLSIIGVGDVVFEIGYVVKGGLVTSLDDGEHLYVENITFQNAHGRDANAAGIRHQGGSLTVVDSEFINNGNGILSNSGSETIHVVNSIFTGNGTDGFAHGIYAHVDRLIIEDSTFVDNLRGHHIKSVSDTETIIYNNIVDDGTGSASYLIDSTGGGDLLVYGNILTKGVNADNSRFIYYDAVRSFGSPGDVIIENNVISAGTYPNPQNLTVIYNETDSIAQFVNNTVTGLPESRLASGLVDVQGGTLDGVALVTTLHDSGAVEHTNSDDIIVLDAQSSSSQNALAGNDTLIGSSGGDLLFAGDDDDLLVGADGKDQLLGQAGDDTIFGGAGNDLISGGAGNDLLSGGSGTNHIFGGDGNDTLIGVGQSAYSPLHGEAGNDLLVGGDTGNERLFGGDGDDTLFGGLGGDAYYGGDGEDILIIRGTFDPNITGFKNASGWKAAAANSTADFSINYGAPWSEYLSVFGLSEAGMQEVGDGLEYYEGDIWYDDAETIKGIEKVQFDNGVYDVATQSFTPGLQLVDLDAVLAGLPVPPAGSETLTGTAADDTFSVASASGFNEYGGLEGNDEIVATSNDMSIRLSRFDLGDVESISAGGFSGVNIASDSANNTLNFSATSLIGISNIDAGAGNDTVVGSSGNDYIIGGFGNDSLSGGNGDDTFEIGIGAGADFIDGDEGYDTVVFTESIAAITLSNADFTSAAIEEFSRSTSGTISITASGSNVNFDLSGSVFTNVVSTTIHLNGSHDTLIGTSLNDTIIGGEGRDSLAGGAGDDTFLVGVGHHSDRFDGGAGTDTIRATEADVEISFYSNSSESVRSALQNVEVIDAGGFSGVTITGSTDSRNTFYDELDFSNVTLIGIESINVGVGNDTVIGSAASDLIIGGAGHDSLSGGDGDDIFLVGLDHGADRYDGGSGIDTIRATADNVEIGFYNYMSNGVRSGLQNIEVIDAGGFGGVTITGSPDNRNTFYDELDFSNVTLIGIESINVGAGHDTVIGSAGADVIIGGTGNDQLTGGAGDDVFKATDGFGTDTITDFTIGSDIIDFSDTNTQFTDLTITQNGANTQVADSLGNILILEGIQANSLTESDFTFFVTPGLNITGTTGDDSLDGDLGADTIVGGDGNDTIIGGGGADSLDGSTGNDVIQGGRGTDTITGGAGSDVFKATGNFATDIITDFTIGSDVIDFTSTSTQFADLTITQNGADAHVVDNAGNTFVLQGVQASSLSESDFTFYVTPGLDLTGTVGDDSLVGDLGNDTLSGGDGNDTLSGGAGNDQLTGGSGNDTFVFDGGDGDDVITDFAAGDVIDLVATGLQFVDLTITQVGSDTKIADGSGNTITLQGIASSSISASDFAFEEIVIAPIVGTDGNDTIIGTAGDDIIEGRGGNDNLSGGAGDDTFLIGIGSGYDKFDGGAGNDQILATEDGAIIGFDIYVTHFAAGAVETISAGGHSGVT